jgi:hypothetical protein
MYFRFWGHSRHGQICRWVAPVAIDPLQALAPPPGSSEDLLTSDLLGGLMSTINAATICIAAAKANGTT